MRIFKTTVWFWLYSKWKNLEVQRRKELESKLAKLEKEKLDLSSKIEDSQKAITRNEVLVSDMSLEQALNRQKELVETIRRINEKTIQLKIPQQILVLDAEITLLSQTIDDLNKKMQKINEEYPTAN